ncbi:CAP domain-containing protein [Piscinibacter sakaiensis]|uniref:CAP domain-containing protein n=1 Tax=Piscinibacter sakaiensis TaxID=1547922 RepID=UPI003728FC1C
MVDELNLARAQPQAYAQLVAQHYASLGRDRVFTRGELRVQMTEGRPAVDEAIAYLKRAAPQPPLVADACLSDAAQAHALDLGDRSQPSERASRRLGRPTACGENLSQGPETARDHVIALIVDDGVASRAHRTNVFGADYRRVGVGLATHPVFRTVNVNLLCRDAML